MRFLTPTVVSTVAGGTTTIEKDFPKPRSPVRKAKRWSKKTIRKTNRNLPFTASRLSHQRGMTRVLLATGNAIQMAHLQTSKAPLLAEKDYSIAFTYSSDKAAVQQFSVSSHSGEMDAALYDFQAFDDYFEGSSLGEYQAREDEDLVVGEDLLAPLHRLFKKQP